MPIKFSFLDGGDGALVEILHSGPKPEVQGTVIGADMEPAKLARLSDGDLSWTEERGFVRRFGARLRASGLHGRRLLVLVIPFLAIILLSLIVLVDNLTTDSESALVDPAAYDLDEAEGQHAFARAVGIPRSESPMVYALVSSTMFVIFFGFTYMLVGRRLVPYSILRYRPG
ncbi:MAG: hypothetical protein U5K29_00795 [Acidimicrobiales bacterium]|nr:hypothetical protein [Acidimicrobiales bacterium]